MDNNRRCEISVIIITHNGLIENTVPCIESVLRETAYSDCEIIVVDNNSADGTQDYLRDTAAAAPRMKLILNSSNKGVAGGNNDGIMTSQGKYLVLLNNDTVVPKAWLEKLLRPLREDRSVGMTGPVSNAVGNEQLIFTEGKFFEEIMEEGHIWSGASTGDEFETDMLSFFCVVMKRELINAVGLLDERFGLGYFEDTDYCIRVRKAGYRLVCVEDVFVYHKGSSSFGRLPGKTRELLRKNKKLLEEKFHMSYRPRHPRELHMDLIRSYMKRMQGQPQTKELSYKINNRLRTIGRLRPKGLIKRLRFQRQLRALGLASF